MTGGEQAHLDAVQAIYSKHHDWLVSWLRSRLGCSHNAADLAHDTFVRIIGARHLADVREPRAFLTTTARRLVIDQARRKRIEQVYLAELARAARTADAAPSPEQIVVALRALEQIATALQDLADKPRQAFLLHFLEGEPHAAVASRLGVSTRMVQRYLVQALVHCHRLLGDGEPQA